MPISSRSWWPQLTQWAQYLEKYGLDPEDQLCTDDFMGHLAHNANLSVKAILALAAYGDLCRMRGDDGRRPKSISRWPRPTPSTGCKVADDGDHSRLAFDKPDTWSQKYNLVWDQLLGLNVFPARGRAEGSRLLQEGDAAVRRAARFAHQADQDRLVALERHAGRQPGRFRGDRLADLRLPEPHHGPQPVRRLLRDRTTSTSDGMHARPVVGGMFIKMLADPAMWKSWAAKDQAHAGPWTDTPAPAKVTPVVATSQHEPAAWRFTTTRPAAEWTKTKFDDNGWNRGAGGSARRERPARWWAPSGTRPTFGCAAKRLCRPRSMPTISS